ncbi:MAG: hypothetical protein J6S54_02755 [Lentisphaeria bacterium]|nr:hypothetical protein [Lentisphaeria bacterium]
MRKKNTILAAGIILVIPVLMLMQQFLMPRSTPKKPAHLIRKMDHKLLLATEDGRVYNRANATHIAYAAAVYAAQGKHNTAQKWFLLGAAEFRYPSVMLFYGDYHFYHKRYRAARHWYNLSRYYALHDRQMHFLRVIKERTDVLDALEKKQVKK